VASGVQDSMSVSLVRGGVEHIKNTLVRDVIYTGGGAGGVGGARPNVCVGICGNLSRDPDFRILIRLMAAHLRLAAHELAQARLS
jgi:hypothetical protein